MSRPIVAVVNPINPAGIARLQESCETRSIDGSRATPQELLAVLHDADGVIVRGVQVTAALMDQCPRLRIVAKHGAGLDNIDIPAATARGIVVTNTGGANAPAVAETAVTLMLATLRRVPHVHNLVLTGEYRQRWSLLFGDLWERTVGLVGFGNIGGTVARICGRGFNARVLAYDPFADPARMKEAGVEHAPDLEAMLGAADIVSIHTPLTDGTYHLIGERQLRAMKKTAILVNTSRGEVVDNAALAAALADGTIAGAGIDVFEPEPPPADHPLLHAPNVVLSPHVGGATEASRRRAALEAAEAILATLGSVPPKHMANPEVWDSPARRG